MTNYDLHPYEWSAASQRSAEYMVKSNGVINAYALWDAGTKVPQGGEFLCNPCSWLVSSGGEIHGLVRREHERYCAVQGRSHPTEEVFYSLDMAAEWVVNMAALSETTPYTKYVFDCPFCENQSIMDSTPAPYSIATCQHCDTQVRIAGTVT